MSDDLKSALYLAAFLLVIALCVTDCSMGHARTCPGVVKAHVYHAPYTTTHSSHDSQGNLRVHTNYHSAEYRLLVACTAPEHAVNVEVGLTDYLFIQDSDVVMVDERVGRWSSIIWIKKIRRLATVEQQAHPPTGHDY